MKNAINGTDYIPASKVMAWLAEAREIIAEHPFYGTERLRIEHSFTRTGYKVSWISINDLLDKRIANYPHTCFAKRPELIKLVHYITKSLDRALEIQAKKTVEVIRLSDGKHIMTLPEVAKDAVEEGVAVYA